MTPERIAFLGVHLPDGTTGAFYVESGRIAEAGTPSRNLDAAGLAVLPRLCDPHVHLDKTFIGGLWHKHQPVADLSGRIRQELEALDDAEERPIVERALALVRLLVARGSTLVRSHVDISSSIGLTRLEAVLEAREQVANLVEIHLVAFPQQGVVAAPGTAEVLEEALKLGVEAVGGLDPDSFDGDREAQLDTIFDLATKYQRRVDIHLHETGIGGLETMRSISARTRSEGLEGQVCISHGFALATAPYDAVARTIELLGDSGVGLVTSVPGQGLMPPIDLLLESGVQVAVGSDNIRDSWSPFGRGDQLERSALAAYLLGWRSDDQLERCLGLATDVPAQLLGVAPANLAVGDDADFVLVPAQCVAEAMVVAPGARTVYHRGRHVAGPYLVEIASA